MTNSNFVHWTKKLPSQVTYIITGKQMRKLSEDAKRQVLCLLENDMSLCFANNGFEDVICQQMAGELEKLIKYLGVEPYDCHEVA